MLAKKYFEKGFELLRRLQETQSENIEKAAEMISQAVAEGHTFYAWGDRTPRCQCRIFSGVPAAWP